MRTKFNEVFDKAEFAKSKSPDQTLQTGIYAEKLIYDRALEKVRLRLHLFPERKGRSPATNPFMLSLARPSLTWVSIFFCDNG